MKDVLDPTWAAAWRQLGYAVNLRWHTGRMYTSFKFFMSCPHFSHWADHSDFSSPHLFFIDFLLALLLIARSLTSLVVDRPMHDTNYYWSPPFLEILFVGLFTMFVHSPSSVENNDFHAPIFSSLVELLFSPCISPLLCAYFTTSQYYCIAHDGWNGTGYQGLFCPLKRPPLVTDDVGRTCTIGKIWWPGGRS